MKPFVEKLHLDDNTSFYARMHTTPQFEVPWHQHVELELIAFKEGNGTAFIGNYVGEFTEGDIFFLGSNLPHTFQKANKELVVSAVVIQFEEQFLGDKFLYLPETKAVKELFRTSLQGIKLTGNKNQQLFERLIQLQELGGMEKVISLLTCLDFIAGEGEFITVSTQEIKEFSTRNKARIDKVYQFTIDHFSEQISLEQVAQLASMTVPAFCSYFRKSTKKTYVEFLNEVRVGNACKLLTDTQMPVSEICYESGYNTVANFNRQFLKIKNKTPLQYRKLFQSNAIVL